MDCRKCDGCGCPACLGTGSEETTEFVRNWGNQHGHGELMPEDVPNLSVSEQREVQEYVRRSLQ